MYLQCYGVSVKVSALGYGAKITFPAKVSADRKTHVAYLVSWSPSTVDFYLDATSRSKEVVCSLPLWGGACKFVFA